MNDELYLEELKVLADLAVSVRVQCTSLDKPDDDSLSEYRGTDWLRVGSGFIHCVTVLGSKSDETCHCDNCDGKHNDKHWSFSVSTASNVVYNTEEAKATKVDLFYDDESCQHEGRMKTVRAVKVLDSAPELDINFAH